MKSVKVLLITSFLMPPLIQAMGGKDTPLPEGLQKEISVAISATHKLMSTELPKILDSVAQALVAKEEAKKEKIKSLNTLLWSRTVQIPDSMIRPYITLHPDNPNLTFGVYKRDLFEGADIAINLASSYYMYYSIHQARVKHICTILEENIDECTDWLEKLDLAKHDDNNKNFFGTIKVPKQLLKDIERFFKTKSQYIHYNPFKKELMFPLVATQVVTQASNAFKDYYLVNEPYTEETWQAYTCKKTTFFGIKNKEYIPYDGMPPVSALSLLKHLSFIAKYPVIGAAYTVAIVPLGYMRHYLNAPWHHGKNAMKGAIVDYGLSRCPGWVQTIARSRATHIAGDIMILAARVKLVDSAYSYLWNNYVMQNSMDLLIILREYQDAKKDSLNPDNKDAQKRLEESKKKMQEFVKKGNTLSSLLSWKNIREWNNSKGTLNKKVALAIVAPLLLYGITKAGITTAQIFGYL